MLGIVGSALIVFSCGMLGYAAWIVLNTLADICGR